MELHTLENLHEDFETGVWKVRKFVLPNASEYLWDIDNIRWAETGLINAFGSNRFFDEASQMIANSIYLFQEGFFDAAFYSLRQSIEISIGTLYLTANPEKMNEWKKLEPGFESGKMANFLREHEPVFKEIRTKMSTFLTIFMLSRKRRISMYTNKAFSLFIPHNDCLGLIIEKRKFIIRLLLTSKKLLKLQLELLPYIAQQQIHCLLY